MGNSGNSSEPHIHIHAQNQPDPYDPTAIGLPLTFSTYLADGVRKLLSDPHNWGVLPDQVSDWLRLQHDVSVLPSSDSMLVENFPRGTQNYMVCYPFEGRLAHQPGFPPRRAVQLHE